jgi:hypothetical protein
MTRLFRLIFRRRPKPWPALAHRVVALNIIQQYDGLGMAPGRDNPRL